MIGQSSYRFSKQAILPLSRKGTIGKVLIFALVGVTSFIFATIGPSPVVILIAGGLLLAALFWEHEVAWIMIAFFGDLLFAWHWGDVAIFPKAAKWISHLVIGIALLKVLLSVFIRKKKIPKIAIPIIIMSIIGIVNGIINGGSPIGIAWGWFTMFKYSIIAFYIYFADRISDKFIDRFFWFGFFIVIFELGIQVLQYLNGVEIGDSLSGTFGLLGTHVIILLNAIMLCWAAARFLVYNKLKLLLGLGLAALVSSILTEGKIFVFIALAVVLFVLIFRRRGNVVTKIFVLGFGAFLIWGFVELYSQYIGHVNVLDFFLNPVKRSFYLTNIRYLSNGTYDVPRLASLQISFAHISKTIASLLFGYGAGSATQSVSLGIAGGIIEQAQNFLFWRGTLNHILLEYGILGYVGWFIIIILLLKLGLSIQKKEDKGREIGLTIIFYSLLLPFFMFYTYALETSVPNIIFWMLVGYALRKKNIRKIL